MGEKGFFSQGWMALGARPEMRFEQRIAANFLSWAGLAMAGMGPVFAVLNLLNRNYHLAFFNIVGSLLGALDVFAVARGKLSWAVGMLCTAGIMNCFLPAFLFHNGNEILLLVLMTIIMYVAESLFLRRLVAILIGVGYLVIEADHLDSFSHPGITKVRFLVNVFVGLVSIYGYHSMIHSVTGQYRQTIEAKNRDLDAQSRLLQAERARLREANSAEERLFSILSHDLCAPVGHLKEALAYLEDGRLSPEKFRELHSGLKGEVDHLHESMQSLLEWSAQQLDAIEARFASVDLGVVCEEVIGLLGVPGRPGTGPGHLP